MTISCYNCQYKLAHIDIQNISRREECPECRAELRVCKMCLHYSPSHYNECKEPNADRVNNKEKANFCDYFSVSDQSGQKVSSPKEDLLAQANALFKK